MIKAKRAEPVGETSWNFAHIHALALSVKFGELARLFNRGFNGETLKQPDWLTYMTGFQP